MLDSPWIIVRGQSVSNDQAAEILIRTQYFSLDTTSRPLANSICHLLGARLNAEGQIDAEAQMNLIEEYRCLPVYYLRNHYICTSSVWGPHGWCNWSGQINGSGYQAPSKPLAGEIEREWWKIAWTWPFLDLYCQVWKDSSFSQVEAEYRVRGGQVEVITKNFATFLPEERPEDRLQRAVLSADTIPAQYREMGISLSRLFTALQITRHRLGLSPLPEQRLKED